MISEEDRLWKVTTGFKDKESYLTWYEMFFEDFQKMWSLFPQETKKELMVHVHNKDYPSMIDIISKYIPEFNSKF